MRIAIIYGTTEGQTRKICLFVQKKLVATGHSTALIEAASAGDLDVTDFDAVIVAASVHAGRYQKGVMDWVTRHRAELDPRPTLFLSVSLGAAGDVDEDWSELAAIVERMTEDTGWTPGRIEHVAGAFKFSEYDFLKYWAMRWMASQRNADITPGEDAELTDWIGLERTIADWTTAAGAGT